MIANLKKEFDPDDLREASALCHKHHLKFCHSLIFGGPGETQQTVTETIDLMDELKPTAVMALTGIRVLPGTGMVEIALRDGQIDDDDDLLYPKFYISPALGDELIERIETYARAHSNWIVPGKGIKTNVQVLQKLRERRGQGAALATAAMSGGLEGRRALITAPRVASGARRRWRLPPTGRAWRSTTRTPTLRRRRSRRRWSRKAVLPRWSRPTSRTRRQSPRCSPRLKQCWGGVDILVNNAATTHDGFLMMLSRERLGYGPGDQPARGISLCPPGGALDDRRPLGANRQRHFPGGARRQGWRSQLCRLEGRSAQHGQVARSRGGALRHHGQRGLPSTGGHPVDCEHACQGARTVSGPDSAESLRDTGGRGSGNGLLVSEHARYLPARP